MTALLNLLTLVLCAGRKPQAGGAPARRIALLSYHFGRHFNRLILISLATGAIPWLWSHTGFAVYLAIFLGMQFSFLSSALGQGADFETAEYERLMPVDAKSSYRLLFFTGIGFLLLWSVALNAAFFGYGIALDYHLAVATFGAPVMIYTAESFRHTVRLPFVLMATTCMAFTVAIVLCATFCSMTSIPEVDIDFGLRVTHPLAYVVVVTTAYRFGLRRYRQRELVEAPDGNPEAPAAIPVLYPPTTPNVAARMTPPTRSGMGIPPMSDRRATAETRTPRRIADATRRRALLDFVYAGRMKSAKWVLGFWVCLVIPFPPFMQMLMHLLFSALFWEYVATRYWRFNPLEEYALLLPASRTEIFLLRFAPILAVQLVLGSLGLFTTGVLHLPELWYGRHFNIGGDWIFAAAFFIGPLATAALAISTVWPKNNARLITLCWVLIVFGLPKFARTTSLWDTLAGHPVIFAAFLAALTLALLLLAHAGFLKKETPVRAE